MNKQTPQQTLNMNSRLPLFISKSLPIFFSALFITSAMASPNTEIAFDSLSSRAIEKTLPPECAGIASTDKAPQLNAWLAALTQAFALLPNENDQLSVFGPANYGHIKGRPSLVLKPENANAVTNISKNPSQAKLDASSNHAFVLPIKGNMYGQGAAVFGGDIFGNEYFKWHFSSSVPEERTEKELSKWWRPITTNQPWLEWKPESADFEWHANGAQTRILCRMLQQGETVALFRGTNLFEATLINALKATNHESDVLNGRLTDNLAAALVAIEETIAYVEKNHGSKSIRAHNVRATKEELESMVERLKAADSNGAKLWRAIEIRYRLTYLLNESVKHLGYAGLFLSLDKTTAESFAKGAVEEFQVPVRYLLDLNRQHTIYVGVENEVELAILSPSVDEKLADSLQGYAVKRSRFSP